MTLRMPGTKIVPVHCVVCAVCVDLRVRPWAVIWAQSTKWVCKGCAKAHIDIMTLNGARLVVGGDDHLIYERSPRNEESFAIITQEREQPTWMTTP